VREVMQSGWTQTFPSAGYHTVTLTTGTAATGVDFGNRRIVLHPAVDIEKYVQIAAGTGSIGDFVWEDLVGAAQKGNNGVGNGLDPQPPGNPPINDGTGTTPGNPGNQGGADGPANPGTGNGANAATADGIQDAGELGISGVVVNLLNATGQVIATTTTGANGFYLFNGVAAGSYTVEVAASNFATGALLAGWTASPKDSGMDDTR